MRKWSFAASSAVYIRCDPQYGTSFPALKDLNQVKPSRLARKAETQVVVLAGKLHT